MTRWWGGRAILTIIVVVAVADIAAWAFVFHRGPAKSSYVSRLSGNGVPEASASPTPSPSPAAAALPLPDTTGRALNVSFIGDSITAGHFASSPETGYRQLMQDALATRGDVTVQDPTPSGTSDLSTAVTVPTGLRSRRRRGRH